MRKIILFFLIFNFIKLYSQEIYVPYLKKGKYGIYNQASEKLWEPIFDKINISYKPYTFVGLKIGKNESLTSSLLFKNKYILKDKSYFDYRIYGTLVVAVDTISLNTIKYHNRFDNEKAHIYNIDGKLLFNHFFSKIHILGNYGNGKEKDINTTIIWAIDLENPRLSSLFLYDLSQKKVTKTLLYKVKNLKLQEYDRMNWTYYGIPMTYRENETKVSIKIDIIDNEFKIISKTVESYNEKSEIPFYDSEDVPFSDKPIIDTKKKYISEEYINEVYLIDYHKYLMDKNYLKFKSISNKKRFRLFINKEKFGLIDSVNDSIRLDAEYDEIYKLSNLNLFVVKKDNLYGLYFPYQELFIAPKFQFFPYLIRTDYQHKGNKLLGFFTKDTHEFQYYGTIDGKLYKE